MSDAYGLPITLTLTAEQAHDGRSAKDMLGTVDPGHTSLADAFYDSDRRRDRLAQVGARSVIRPIPRRSNPQSFDRTAYRRRNGIERLFSKLKNFSVIGTRYEKA